MQRPPVENSTTIPLIFACQQPVVSNSNSSTNNLSEPILGLVNDKNDKYFNNSSFIHSGDFLLLMAALTAASILLAYHCIIVCSPRRRLETDNAGGQDGDTSEARVQITMAELMPAHKYVRKGGGGGDGDGDGDGGDAGSCAVCLCDFEEGEEVRTMPECVHYFHAPCIDMWLYSHSTCPICRTDTMPSLSFFGPDGSPNPALQFDVQQ